VFPLDQNQCKVFNLQQQQKMTTPLINSPPRSSAITSSSAAAKRAVMKRRPIFCDMDGVLCDFNKGIMNLTGFHPDTLSVKDIWRAVGKSPQFFLNLNWTPDGQELWRAIRHLEPHILSGVPNSRPDEVGRQKAEWCRRNFQTRVNHIDMAGQKPQRHAIISGGRKKENNVLNVISCWSKFKYKECVVPGSILIDDRQKLGVDWVKAGGTFVHHTDTKSTLKKLMELNIIDDDSDGKVSNSKKARFDDIVDLTNE
jgi:hypothetical protein